MIDLLQMKDVFPENIKNFERRKFCIISFKTESEAITAYLKLGSLFVNLSKVNVNFARTKSRSRFN